MYIGLTGLAGSGKDTAGNYLASKLGLETIAFADELREIMWEINIPLYSSITGAITYQDAVREFGYDSTKRAFPDVRRVLDSLGTGVIRNRINDGYFVDVAIGRAKSMKGAVITDARFDNEKRAVKESLGGTVIQVVREGVKNLGLESEKMSDRYVDYVVMNDGTIDDLYKKLDLVVSNVL